MIKLRIYDSMACVYRQKAISVDRDFDQTFRDLLQGGWLREEPCGEILKTLTGARWQDEQDYALLGPEGESRCAACLPMSVRLALTVAVNSRRGIWTMIPQDGEFDWTPKPPYGLPTGTTAEMWDCLAIRQEEFLLIVGMGDGTDQGLLAALMEHDRPLRVSFHGHWYQGPVGEMLRALVKPVAPMELMNRIRRCMKEMPLDWQEQGPPFEPRYVKESGLAEWTFRNFLAAEPYCPDENWPILRCHTPTLLTVTRDWEGRIRLEQPLADTLLEPELPPQALVYDNLLVSCAEGMAPGDLRTALVVDAAPWQLGQDSAFQGLCLGFVLDEAERRADLYEGRGALDIFQKALAKLLGWQERSGRI